MHPLSTEEVSDIDQRISWIAHKLRGNSEDFYERILLAEIERLQKEKTRIIKKFVVEQVAEKYPDLAVARAVKSATEERDVFWRNDDNKFKKVESLRVLLGLKTMRKKASEIVKSAHKERKRLEKEAGLEDHKNSNELKEKAKNERNEKRNIGKDLKRALKANYIPMKLKSHK